jgi:ADP-heptose:LPS heptosyltransferase
MPDETLIDGAVSKILVLTTSHVGNTMFCTPAVHVLRRLRPHATLDVVVMSRRAAAVFADSPDVDRVFRMTTTWSVRRLARRYDVVVGFHQDWARPYAAALGVKLIAIGPLSYDAHRADQVLDFVRGLVGSSPEDGDRRYVFEPGARHRSSIDSLLEPWRGRPLVGFHLGTGRTAIHGWKFWYAKREKDPRLWPVDRYVELAKRLRQENPDLGLVITGSRNERFLGARFEKEIAGTVNLIGRTTLHELAALMDRLEVFVTPDNGAMHVASSTEVPLVALFSISSPVQTGPYPSRAQHVLIRSKTITDITPAEVSAAVLGLARRRLEGTRGKRPFDVKPRAGSAGRLAG